ncbi:MAG: hypothetical protein ACE37F_32895 [Nannocystaceae bacterium]|nr:hypothetical protein [bacterium]
MPARLHRRSFCSGFLAACGCASAPAPATAPAPPAPALPFDVVDLMPAFFAFWDAHGPRATDAFLREVVAEHPEVYAPNVIGYDDGTALRSRVEAWLPRAQVETMRSIHADFGPNLRGHARRFVSAFDDFDWDGRVFLMASIDAFNGASRRVGDRAALLFGLDVIARTSPPQDLAVLMHHELFHMYQASGARVLADALWVEGLATLASIELNPGTSDDEALPQSHLHDPEDPQLDAPARRVVWSRDMPEHAASMGPGLLAALDSSAQDDYATFFLGRASPKLGRRPVRTGYWYGLQVARLVCAERSVRALAKVPLPQMRPAVRDAMQALVGMA